MKWGDEKSGKMTKRVYEWRWRGQTIWWKRQVVNATERKGKEQYHILQICCCCLRVFMRQFVNDNGKEIISSGPPLLHIFLLFPRLYRQPGFFLLIWKRQMIGQHKQWLFIQRRRGMIETGWADTRTVRCYTARYVCLCY